MEQKNTHRITKVAKELGVGVSSLIEFFSKKGISGLTPNSKIDNDQYEMALSKFGDAKLIKEKIKEQKELEAQIRKNSVSLDENDDEENQEQNDSENVQRHEEETVFVVEKNEPVENKIKKETLKIEEQKEKKRHIDGPKILGKMELNNNKKIEKKKREEKVEDKQEEKNNKKIEEKEEEQKKITVIQEENKKEITEKKIEEKEQPPIKNEESYKKEEIEKKKDKLEIKEEKKEVEEIAEEKKEIKKEIVEEKQTKISSDNDKESENKIEEKNNETSEIILQPEKKEESNKLTGPKVVGKIDLDKMNLKTRPDRKSKKEKEEERKKKRIEKDKTKKDVVKPPIKQTGKPTDKPVTPAANNDNKRHKRKRIEKVEINKEGRIINKERKKVTTAPKTPVVIDEKDVQKQVRETLQKLEQRQKSKASKFRREKRKEHHQRISDEFDKQQADNEILKVTEFITVKEISDLMNVSPNAVIEVCFDIGQPVTINYRLDAELINLIAGEFDFAVEFVQSSFEEEIELALNSEDNQVEPRPPIVTVMGHVDHGKTSLLDYIRKTNVAEGESGGITQHIGAYSVTLEGDKKITFIDTPGHEAFTAMRARGTKVTDIAIIIIAADDSIMPQTEEAIDHAKAGNVPMIFAINKIDKPGADPEKIKQQLAAKNILVESWGGKYGSVEISAKKGIGIDELLERVALEAEMLELKADSDRNAIGTVLEARLDKGRGYITNVIVRTGTLKLGDMVVAGGYYGKIKALFNEFNKRTKTVGPSGAIQILGLNGAPEPGEPMVVMDSDKEAREKAEHRLQIIREMEFRARKRHSLEEISRRFAEGEKLDLNIIVKADVKGSVDAITDQLTKLSNEEVNVNVVRSAVGQISDTDVMLAAASTAITIGFNVRPSLSARKIAENKDVEIRLYSIIYDIINDIKAAVHGMLKPEMKEEIIGSAEVMDIFKVTKVGTIAGSIVREGKITSSSRVRLIRDGIVVYTGNLKSLKRFKDDAKEVLKGFECGIGIDNFNDIKPGDYVEAFKEFEVEREL
ncbi:MAG: translation initiation factor IF-2 [Bacteroidales bacterium]|nr:translation initiation factor IF-2 [Bacteroidales bacterium]